MTPSEAVDCIEKRVMPDDKIFNELSLMVFNKIKGVTDEWFRDFINLNIGQVESKQTGHAERFLEVAAFANARFYGTDEYYKNLQSILNFLSKNKILTQEGLFCAGLANYGQGNFAEAERYFKEYSAIKEESVLFHRTAAPLYRANDTHFKYKKIIGDYSLVKKANTSSCEIVLVSCESGYLKAYGEDFYKIIKSFDINASIHFHVINPINEFIKNFNFINDANIGLSTEKVNFKNIATYSSVSRYLISEFILQEYDKDLIISDIDVLFKMPPRKILSLVSGDFGLFVNQKQGRSFPWTYYLAGIGVYKKSPQSTLFLRKVSKFISNSFDDEVNCWMLDQLALEHVANGEAWDFFDLNEAKLPLSQFSDRPARRAIARKFLSRFNKPATCSA